jgi:hypothetical protein
MKGKHVFLLWGRYGPSPTSLPLLHNRLDNQGEILATLSTLEASSCLFGWVSYVRLKSEKELRLPV